MLKNIVHGLLTRDAIQRKARDWHLLSDREMDSIYENRTEILQKRDQKVIQNTEDIFVSYGRDFDNTQLKPKAGSWKGIEANAIWQIDGKFRYIRSLLNKFDGKIVAAGGAVFRACANEFKGDEDIDIFFLDQGFDSIHKYTEFLNEVVSFLVSECLKRSTVMVVVTRNEHVTTVYAYGEIPETATYHDEKYQFIHRVYPNVGSILGGFDIGACMMAYTASGIFATELGAWCFFNRAVIVDTTRRSTSYEHRLTKYSHSCHIIFPGLMVRTVNNYFSSWKTVEQVREEIDNFLEENNIKTDTAGEGDVIFTKADTRKEEVKEKIRSLAAKYGYWMDEVKLYGDGHGKNLSIAEERNIHETMKHIARSNHCYVDLPVFKQSLHDDDYSDGLYRHQRVVAMPYLSVNTGTRYYYKRVTTTPRSMGMPKYHAKMSDYDDSRVFGSHMVMGNVTCLVNGGRYLSGAVSVLVFKRSLNSEDPTTSLIYPKALDCFEAIHEFRDQKEVQEVLAKSFENPQLGNLRKAFDMRRAYYQGERKSAFFRLRTRAMFGSDTVQDDEETFSKIEQNAIMVKERLKGVNWITQNPGRQWTSSINPIMKNPRDWYGEFYTSFRIGCEEVETTMRLMRLRKESPFFSMDKNIFNYIVQLVVWKNSLISK